MKATKSVWIEEEIVAWQKGLPAMREERGKNANDQNRRGGSASHGDD